MPVNLRRPPGPQGNWLLGNLAEFRDDYLAFYERCRDQFGDCAAFRLGPRRMLLVSAPSGVEEVLVTRNRDFRKHYMMRLLRPLLGNGVLTSDGPFWLRQRRLMQPLFSRERIATYGEIFARHAQREVESWRAGQTRDVHADMQRLTMGIVAESLMGVDIDDALFREVHETVMTITEDFLRRVQQLAPLPPWLPTPGNRRLRSAIGRLERVIYEIMERKRGGNDTSDDLLARLLRARDEAGNGMTDKQLRDEVMTLFLAGHETTANALTWTFYLLGQHPQVADRLRREIDEVVGEDRVTAGDFERLAFTGRVLKESMRLLPPVYAFGREALRGTEIAGYRVRKGTTVILSPWVVQRDSRFYDRPTDFDPDRWTPQFERSLPSYAYFPFGGGPRVCIGNAFSLLEATLVLVTVHRRCDLRLVSRAPAELWPSITLRPRHGIAVEVAQPRRGENGRRESAADITTATREQRTAQD